MMSNFHRMGVKQLSCGVVLAWDDPDLIGVMALEKSIERFSSFTVATPLTRGASAEPLPPAFRAASLPLSEVRGGYHGLPVVNRVAVADAMTGGDSAWAGFSMIDSEPDEGYPFLCARWDDRVVFSFALCHVMRQREVSWRSVEVWPGKWIRLGKKGPVIPIDDTGRMLVKPDESPAVIEQSAEDLIDAPDDWLPAHISEPVILADLRGMAEAPVRAFSGRLCDEVALLASSAGFGEPIEVPRISSFWEWLGIEWVAFTMAGLLWIRPRWALAGLGLFSMVLIGVQMVAFHYGAIWLPAGILPVAIPVTTAAILWRGSLLRKEEEQLETV